MHVMEQVENTHDDALCPNIFIVFYFEEMKRKYLPGKKYIAMVMSSPTVLGRRALINIDRRGGNGGLRQMVHRNPSLLWRISGHSAYTW